MFVWWAVCACCVRETTIESVRCSRNSLYLLWCRQNHGLLSEFRMRAHVHVYTNGKLCKCTCYPLGTPPVGIVSTGPFIQHHAAHAMHAVWRVHTHTMAMNIVKVCIKSVMHMDAQVLQRKSDPSQWPKMVNSGLISLRTLSSAQCSGKTPNSITFN